MNKEQTIRILKELEKGTTIYVKNNEEIIEAEFIKMNRTRFIAYFEGQEWSCSWGLFKGIKGKNKELQKMIDIENSKKNKEKINYIYKNNNPKGLKTKDCAIRALAECLNITWEEAMMKLAKTSCKTGLLINKDENIIRTLQENSFLKIHTKQKTITDFVEYEANAEDTYYVFVKKHATTIKGFDLIDTWDCRYEKIESIYKLI